MPYVSHFVIPLKQLNNINHKRNTQNWTKGGKKTKKENNKSQCSVVPRNLVHNSRNTIRTQTNVRSLVGWFVRTRIRLRYKGIFRLRDKREFISVLSKWMAYIASEEKKRRREGREHCHYFRFQFQSQSHSNAISFFLKEKTSSTDFFFCFILHFHFIRLQNHMHTKKSFNFFSLIAATQAQPSSSTSFVYTIFYSWHAETRWEIGSREVIEHAMKIVKWVSEQKSEKKKSNRKCPPITRYYVTTISFHSFAVFIHVFVQSFTSE